MKFKLIPLLLLCLSITTLQAQVDRSQMPKSGPPPEINLGNPATFQLDNGLKVIVVEHHALPRVQASLIIDNKPYAQGSKTGVKAIYSAMMGKGTQKIGKDEFNERIDFLGADVSYGAQGASAASLRKFFPEVFKLMAKGLLYPKFTAQEFETQKKRLIASIKSVQNSTSAIAARVTNALVYGKHHPYGEFPTEASVNNVNLSDVKSYYHNFITAQNAYLVVVGDIQLDTVKQLVEKYFDTWNSGTPPSSPLPEVYNVQYTQVNFVNMPNAVQSEIAVTNPIHLKKTNSDYFAALMANQILGGGAGGRLYASLREDKGYTYGAYSAIESDKYVSDFRATASVRNEVTDGAVVAFLNEIWRMTKEKVSFQELQLAKAKYTGSFVRSLEDPATIARYALNIQKDNLPKDFYRNYLKSINAVSVEEVLQAAKKYFKPGHARIVIAGNGGEVAASLENLSYNGKAIPVKYFTKKAEQIDTPVFVKSVPDSVTAASIFDRYLRAIGGRDTLQTIRTIYMEASGQMSGHSINLIVKRTKTGKTMSKVSLQGTVIRESVFNGQTGYVKIQGQKQVFTDQQNKAAKHNKKLFDELSLPDNARVTGIQKVDGEEAYVVKLGKKTAFYSVDSGLKLQTVTRSKLGTTTAKYSDYKTVNGVRFPFVIVRSVGPRAIRFKVDKIKINKNVSDTDFQ